MSTHVRSSMFQILHIYLEEGVILETPSDLLFTSI